MESKLDRLYQCLQSVQCEIIVKIEDVSFEEFIDVSNAFSYDQKLLKNNMRKPYRILSVQNITEFISSKGNETILWVDPGLSEMGGASPPHPLPHRER